MKRLIRRSFFPIAAASVSISLLGCGAPGVPVAPAPLVATTVADLSAEQQGEGVKLIFTPPTRAITGDRLKEAPAVEIVRGSLHADGSPNLATFRVVDTIPGSLVPDHMLNGHVVFVDPVTPETAAASNSAFVYVVRTRASQKRASADSNSVIIHLVAVPERISKLDLRLSKSAIDLSWNPPAHTSAGAPLNVALHYEIFRTESPDAAQSAPAPAAPLSSTDSTTYQDRAFRFGATYCYTVRSIVAADQKNIASSESPAVCVAAKDTFPPAAPTDLVATTISAAENQSLAVDLSWAISEEPELAGYRIYRSDQQGARVVLLNQTLSLSPSYRDLSVTARHQYWYSVTAVDRAGNESVASPEISVDLSSPSN